MVAKSTKRRFLSDRLSSAGWLLITILLGLPLIAPLLRWSAVACTHDGHLHYHRVAAMAHAWADGLYLTRWLPDLAFGYGYPFFVYREAAPLYAVLLPHLAGLPLPAASNLFYAVTILMCGVFMFLWVRDLFGPRAALVSAVAYMAAPYVMVDAVIRGNSPESLALPLFPFLLWAGRRWVLYRSVRSFIGGVLGLFLLSVGHNISTLIFAPTLLVYLLAVVWVWGSRGVAEQEDSDTPPSSAAPPLPRSSALFRVFSLIALGLGLAFFYTGGALLEMDQVTLEMSTTTRNNDWRFNFASLGEILAPVAPEDPALVNPPLLLRLGWVPLGLAAVGLSGLWWIRGDGPRDRERRLHIWLMAVATAAYLFMALPVSRWLWEALPLIDFVQFPWRFVGRAALPVAFLAGVPFYWFERRGWATEDGPQMTERGAIGAWGPVIAVSLAIALLIVEAIPNLYPRYCVEEPFPTIQTVHAYERTTGLVGVDPEGSYFPRTVRQRPAGSPLEADYAAGRTPQRFDTTALPAGAQIREVAYGRQGVTLTVESPESFTARYLSFGFPGWTARVDGRPVPITPEDPSGLITFDVPAGTHDIAVEWGPTPLRLALVALSALSAVGAVAVAAWGRRSPPNLDRRPLLRIGRGELAVLGLLALSLLGVKLFVDRVETPLRRTAGPAITYATALRGGELRLDGFNLSRKSVPAGETFDIDLAWTAVAPPVVDYQSEISLVGADGLAWSQKGTERPRLYEDMPPTRQWTPGEWAWDSREVQTLSGAPPGMYDIVVTLFDRDTLVTATMTDLTTGKALGPTAVIGQIEVVNPATPPNFTPQYPADHTVSDGGLRLLGHNQDRTEAIPGEAVLMTFFWECRNGSVCDRFVLRLEDRAGASVEDWVLPVVREGLEADAWPAHGRLRGQHLVQLPAGLASGDYRFVIEDFSLGDIAVTAPDRQFESPALSQAVDAVFSTAGGDVIATLVGITTTESSAADTLLPLCTANPLPPGSCALPVVWRAEAETPTSFHVFVHLVDATGNILAQSDAIPANWTRPTTGWLPGEYVVDTHTLSLPAELPTGPLSIRVGLYEPATGERLRTDGADYSLIEIRQ